MIRIMNEVTIYMSDADEQPLALWLVAYGPPQDMGEQHDDWPIFVEALSDFCARQGWLMETGDDPYREKMRWRPC